MTFFRALMRPATQRGLAAALFGGVIYQQYDSSHKKMVLSEGTNKKESAELSQKMFDNRPWNWNWDGRHGKNEKARRRTLIFVRHGQYVHAPSNLDKDRKLTELGKEQAKLTGQRLNKLFPNKTITQIVYSTMTRATETSNIIRQELSNEIPATPSDLIREGAVYKPIPAHPSWQPTDEDFKVEGGRIEKGFQTFLHRRLISDDINSDDEAGGEDVTLFVCHGNVIRYFFMNLLQLPKSVRKLSHFATFLL